MSLLDQAADHGTDGQEVVTVGGRTIRMTVQPMTDGDIEGARSAAASRGRYARNAIIQGAAAELFKVWAVIVRRRCRSIGGRVVLCLHDELLVHVDVERANEASDVVIDALAEAAHYWSPTNEVRFVVDVSVVERWSDAKG